MNTLKTNVIPEGYLQNGSGHLVPAELVSDIDKTRNNLVMEIVSKANDLRGLLADFKTDAFGDIQAFAELSAEKYGIKLGGIKGNITLSSFDGRYQLKLSQADVKIFDERLHAAKELVDSCIHRWTEGSRAEIKALVEHAFQTDREGKISLGRIYQLDIDDEEWQQAMQALRDSMRWSVPSLICASTSATSKASLNRCRSIWRGCEMQTAQRETPEQLLDRVLDLNPPLVEEVTRKDICARLEISLGKIVDIVGNYPHLNFPAPIGRGRCGTLIYAWHAVQEWAELNPIDKILWTQSEKVEKPIIGLDPLLAMAFITGRYDPEERQLDNMRRRIAARSVIRRRGGAAL